LIFAIGLVKDQVFGSLLLIFLVIGVPTTHAFYVWSPSPPTVGWLLFRHLMLPDLTPLVNNPRIISGHYLMFTL